jgi:predicted N-acetyltransferase YhbS
MKLVRWTRFTWDLEKLPPVDLSLDSHYRIRPILREEEKLIRDVVISAFSLDMDWADTLKTMQEGFEADMAEVFTRKESFGLVVTHGSRIIGASVLDIAKDSENHLVTGPSVLVEYRNRGLGSALLYQSLQFLHDHEVEFARGLTKNHAPAAKFLYPKFASTAEEYQPEDQLVGS